MLSFGNLVGKSSSLPVDSKYQKGQSKGNYIILLFNSKYKRQCINVIFLNKNVFSQYNVLAQIDEFRIYLF
jgi:hypothetical protein